MTRPNTLTLPRISRAAIPRDRDAASVQRHALVPPPAPVEVEPWLCPGERREALTGAWQADTQIRLAQARLEELAVEACLRWHELRRALEAGEHERGQGRSGKQR